MRNILFPALFFILIHTGNVLYGQITGSIIGADGEVCLGDSVAAFLNFSGGTGPWNAVINDKDGEYLVLDSLPASHTIWLKPNEDNTYVIASVEDSKGTPGSPLGEAPILVRQATDVEVIMDRRAFLQSEPGFPINSSPAGASFSGPGVAGKTFYPGIATAVGSPHTLLGTLTNGFGCVSSDTALVHVLSGQASVFLVSGGDTITAVCDDGATYYLRGFNEDGIPGQFELVAAGSGGSVPGHITDPDPNDDEAVLNPVGLSGPYDIIYSYGMEQVTVQSILRFHVNDLGIIEIPGLPDTVCKNDRPYLLVPGLIDGDPGATYIFSGKGVSGNQDEGYYYDPGSSDAPVGKTEITLDYTSSNGCMAHTVKNVYNGFVPAASFMLSPTCLPVEGGLVTFTNMTSGKFSVARWEWDFGHPESGADNVSNLENPTHLYNAPGHRVISLTATTHDGCKARHSVDTVLADQPGADFTWLNDCFIRGERTSLISRSISDYARIDTLVWTFKTSGGGVLGVIGSGSPTDTIEFPFTSTGQYLIELKVENEAGCSGDATKEFVLKPITKLSKDGYQEDFNGGADGWMVFSQDDRESWVLDQPDFAGFEQIQGDYGWFTKLPEHTTGYLEHSWVQSPCFDMTGLKQPIIQMELMKSFVPGTDGAVLQYQDLVSEGWKTLGNVGEGLNWYNVWGIFNQPGGSSFGWGLPLFDPDKHWISAGHSLDVLEGSPHVKFRVAVATGGSREINPGVFNQGFAFDNFFIGEQHRYSLLEHFTNAASMAAKDADQVVDRFSIDHSNSVVDLQYHTDYPGEDAMNEHNPMPASVRSFHYGVPGVPYALLNGGSDLETRYDFSDPSREPDEDALNKASLEMPKFGIALKVDYLDNRLEATVTVTCEADTFASNLQLYVAVIEREVTAYTGLNQDTSFRNVVLDMLPTPAGKLLGSGWNQGRTERLTFTWDYAEFVEDIEDLCVVAFVQDRDNGGKILQVKKEPHTPGVGIKSRVKDTRSLVVYPNPARDHLYVNFGRMTANRGQLNINDLSGRNMMQLEVIPGYNIQYLDISHLPGGMYMITWVESDHVKGRARLLLTR